MGDVWSKAVIEPTGKKGALTGAAPLVSPLRDGPNRSALPDQGRPHPSHTNLRKYATLPWNYKQPGPLLTPPANLLGYWCH